MERTSLMTASSRAARTLLWLTFLAFLVFGLLAVVVPHWLARAVDISLGSSTALADFRAIYGGLSVGVGLFALGAVYQESWTLPAVALTAVCLFTIALWRVYSWVASGAPSPIIVLFAGAELVGGLLALRVYRRLSTRRGEAA
jgi:hypothetical protein